MAKQRLDKELMRRGYAVTRSQAEDIIRRGFVLVKNAPVTKPGYLIDEMTTITVAPKVSFVSRAGEKLHSVVDSLALDFKDKVVLDVGSSTGGFTELALRNGAKKVIAVDVGTDQLHPTLRTDPRVELHEKTDIRKVVRRSEWEGKTNLGDQVGISEPVEMVVADVSFISLRDILPHIAELVTPATVLVCMVKPQFEAGNDNRKHKGVVKNDRMRRDILKSFEEWAKQYFVIIDKADSQVAGAKGNIERFYKMRRIA